MTAISMKTAVGEDMIRPVAEDMKRVVVEVMIRPVGEVMTRAVGEVMTRAEAIPTDIIREDEDSTKAIRTKVIKIEAIRSKDSTREEGVTVAIMTRDTLTTMQRPTTQTSVLSIVINMTSSPPIPNVPTEVSQDSKTSI